MERNAEYIVRLQERNRLKRQMQAKSNEEIVKEEKERGFSMHFRGAHAQKDGGDKTTPPPKNAAKPFAQILGKVNLVPSTGWGTEKRPVFEGAQNEECQRWLTTSSPKATEQGAHEAFDEYDVHEDGDDTGYVYSDGSRQEADVDEEAAQAHQQWNSPPAQLQAHSLSTVSEHVAGRAADEDSPPKELPRRRRQQWGKGRDDGDVDVKTDKDLEQRDTSAASDRETDGAPVGVRVSVELEQTLQTRVKGLSAQQKLKLLRLLEEDVGQEDPTDQQQQKGQGHVKKEVDYEDDEEEGVGGAESDYSRRDASATPTATDVDIEKAPLSSVSRCIEVVVPAVAAKDHMGLASTQEEPPMPANAGPAPAPLTAPTNAAAAAAAASMAGFTETVTLRIRVLTGWARAKTVSLRAIRLRAVGGQGVEAQELLLGAGVSCKVCSGLLPLPTSSEPVRNLKQLTAGMGGAVLLQQRMMRGSGTRPVSASRRSIGGGGTAELGDDGWKGPLASDRPLELVFEGVPVPPSPGEAQLVQLLLWNASTPPLNSTAARDVDVYLGSRCVWSGQLDEPAGTDASSADGLSLGSDELPPSLLLLPFALLAGSSNNTAGAVLPQHTFLATAVEGDRTVGKGILSSSTRAQAAAGKQQQQRDPPTPTRGSPSASLRRDAAPTKPSWLLGAGAGGGPVADAQLQGFHDFDPPAKSRLPARKRDAAADNADNAVNAAAVEEAGATTVPRSPPKSARRGRRSVALAEQPEQLVLTSPACVSKQPAKSTPSTSPSASPSRPEEQGSQDRRRLRRNRSHLLRDLNKTGDGARGVLAGGRGAVEDAGFTQSLSPQRDAQLRKSLEALAHNERFNMGLGRLSTSKLPLAAELGVAVPAPAEGVPGVEVGQGGGEGVGWEGADLRLQSSQAQKMQLSLLRKEEVEREEEGEGEVAGLRDSLSESVIPPLLEDSLDAASPTRLSPTRRRAAQPQPQVPSTTAATSAASRSTREAGRTQKIDRVQRQIDSTIAGLAEIMSAMPGSLSRTSSVTAVGTGTVQLSVGKHSESPQRTVVSAEQEVNNASTGRAGTSATKGPVEAVGEPGGAMSFGRVLVLEVWSTWGDSNYVGLNGLELYDGEGCLLRLHESITSIEALPSGLGVLRSSGQQQEENAAGAGEGAEAVVDGDDPRCVQNLLDGVNVTKNDLHLWLAPHLCVVDPSQAESEAQARGEGDPLVARITVSLRAACALSMLRIFNFNKSRTHNQRGVRRCCVLLDGQVVFRGEVQRASGQLSAEEAEAHLIFLPGAPRSLAQRLVPSSARFEEVGGEVDLEESWAAQSQARPRTSAGIPEEEDADDEAPTETAAAPGSPWKSRARDSPVPVQRPAAVDAEMLSESNTYLSRVNKHAEAEEDLRRQQEQQQHRSYQQSSTVETAATRTAQSVATALCASVRVLRLEIESTWGDPSYVGLSGLEVLVLPRDGAAVVSARISADQLHAHPKDLSEIGCFDDPRVLGNLVNGENDGSQDACMWLIPFTPGSTHFVEVDLRQEMLVVGVRVWNYNKCGEGVLRGCRQVQLLGDGRPLCRCLLRLGPGCDGVRTGQTVLFSEVQAVLQGVHPHCRPGRPLPMPAQIKDQFRGGRGAAAGGGAGLAAYKTPPVRQDYETPLLPTGLLWTFTFFDNWNDGYYIGLDGIELFDAAGAKVDLAAVGAQVSAVPFALADLSPALAADPRTPDKLFSPSSPGAAAGAGCWLCPLSRCMTPQERSVCAGRLNTTGSSSTSAPPSSDLSFPLNNVLLVLFPFPVALSAVRLFNYSKTPARGVRDFQLEVDGLLLYMGSLQRADSEKPYPQVVRAGQQQSSRRTRGQSVLFTNDNKIVQMHKDTVHYCGSGEQDVLCINERQVMVRSKHMYDQQPPNAALEGVQSDLQKRPMTSFVG